MSAKRQKWNPPSWPWELELITLIFFLAALFVPYYFHSRGLGQSVEEIQQVASEGTLAVGQNLLSTQIGFLWALAISAIYIIHLAISAIEINRVTASPLHLLAPVFFAVVAYYRIADIPNLQNTALNMIDGSVWQMLALVGAVGIVTSLLARLRTFRYLLNFSDVNWDVVSPAHYDGTYTSLLLQMRPLLYAPRRYRACREGILIEGFFYAMPIGFNDVHSISILNSSSAAVTGHYYAGSSKNLIRIELHDSLKPTFISPVDRENFARYCVQHIARRRPSHKANPTRHGVLHASDTHAATTHGTGADTNHGTGRSASSTHHTHG